MFVREELGNLLLLMVCLKEKSVYVEKDELFCFLIKIQQLFLKLKNLMRPYSVEFESPLELSAQGESQQLQRHSSLYLWCWSTLSLHIH